MTLIPMIASYLTWANDAIWEIVEDLNEEEYNRILYDAGGSVHHRYVHLAEDTWEWFHDWQGEVLEEPDFQAMSKDDLYEFISKYVRKWIELTTNRNIDVYQNERAGKIVKLQFDEIFFHLVNHFTYHRGQIVMGLRMLGKEVPMTDYVPFRFSTS